jgi:hypothetical protein
MAKEANERCFDLLRENARLVMDNERLEALQFDIHGEPDVGGHALEGTPPRECAHALQRTAVTTIRSGGVEAMAMNFEQGMAGEVAKAGLRAKPGPKKKGNICTTKKTTGRGKPNYSEWTSEEIRVEKPNFSNGAAEGAEERRGRRPQSGNGGITSQRASAIRTVIAHMLVMP